MSTTQHSSTISIELSVCVVLPDPRSCPLVCTGSFSAGRVSDGLVEAVSPADVGLSEAPGLSGAVVESMAVDDTGSAFAAASGLLTVAVASASALLDLSADVSVGLVAVTRDD